MKNNRGTASIELVAMAPLVALFIIIGAQLAALFSHAIHNVAEADAMAENAVLEWDVSHDGKGLDRPCIEKMQEHVFKSPENKLTFGVGLFARAISTQQEVKIAAIPICVP